MFSRGCGGGSGKVRKKVLKDVDPDREICRLRPAPPAGGHGRDRKTECLIRSAAGVRISPERIFNKHGLASMRRLERGSEGLDQMEEERLNCVLRTDENPAQTADGQAKTGSFATSQFSTQPQRCG